MQLIKNLLPKKLKEGIKDRLGVPSLRWSLENLKRCNYAPHYVVDGGAYVGQWTEEFLAIFPNARILMIEAQEGKRASLEKIAGKRQNVKYVISLLGAKDNSDVYFVENDTISYASNEASKGGVTAKTMSLDALIEQQGKEWPDFLKLDVQGYELEVLEGAKKCLEHLQVCLLEVSVFDWKDRKVPLISEVLTYMEQKGFTVYDITQITRRPLDKALNQIDLIFVKQDSFLIADKRWQEVGE